MKAPSLDPLGQALLEYWNGNPSAVLIHEFKNGDKRELPVSVFFRSPDGFFPTEKALPHCRGRVLVVGAGTGVHALELERAGHGVTAMDICPEAVQIMKERGVKDARHRDFFQFNEGRYDTILMLGQNIGMCQNLQGIKGLLDRCRSLLNPGGWLLVNSVEESGGPHYPENGYPGELVFRLSHGGHTGPWMHWLHVDFNTLKSHACGWETKELASTKDGAFLAGLTPMD